MLNQLEIKPLDWDSSFFGFKVARAGIFKCDSLYLKSQMLGMKEAGFRLVYAIVQPADNVSNTSCIENGGQLTDEKITYSLENLIENEISDHIKPYSESSPNEQLYNLSLQSGVNSRFKTDHKIGREKFERLYSLWIENSVKKIIADEFLVYINKGGILGFVSLTTSNSPAVIGLISVDPDYQGLNIGRELISACVNLTLKKNISRLEVVTQKANEGACRFYEKCGFRLLKVENIYHFWL